MMVRIVSFVLAFSMFIDANAYEINNHADMTETAALKSSLTTSNGANGKLFRLGLRPFAIDRTEQTFPLDANLPAIPYCFGSYLPGSTARQYDQAVAAGQTVTQDPAVRQPTWGANGVETKLTIADFFRYGACFEDSEAPQKRPLAHFYNPQDNGAGLDLGYGPSSLDWMLKRSPGNTVRTGDNHYTWEDARNAFYYALTGRNLSENFPIFFPDVRREAAWGRTFQALGHVMHHLQDMGSPQHVRNDQHCNDPAACNTGAPGILGIYRPSGYEFYFDTQFQIIRNLAATATTPILFGLPREFWNVNTSNEIVTTNPTRPMNPNEGMAAYTSTNFTSAGKDFRGFSLNTGSPQILPASGLAFPRPSGQWNDVSVTELFAPESLPAVSSVLCSGNLGNCKMRFMGTEQNPTARTSSTSVFSQVLLRPQSAYSGPGAFQQNFYTYSDAVTKLIPKAVEYSAGLINYFFRGEMEISLPDEGVYGVVDHAVEKTKGADGYRFIKMKVKNTTQAISRARGILPQHMTNGEFRAVAKFRRNTCYTPDLMGQIGTFSADGVNNVATNSPGSCRSAVDEVVVSNAESVDLLAGEQKTFGFDFSNPIPIEATDLFLQVVFKGKLGEEDGAVAVTTKDVSEPTFFTYANANDYELDYSQTPPAPIAATGSTFFSNASAASWLGFARDDAHVRVLKMPGSGIAAGKFVRVALIGDLHQAADTNPVNRAVYAGNNRYTVSQTRVFEPLIDLGESDIPVWQIGSRLFNYIATSSGSVRGVTQTCLNPTSVQYEYTPCNDLFSVSALQVQADADGESFSNLPSYWLLRGLPIARSQSTSLISDRYVSALVTRFEVQISSGSFYSDGTTRPDLPTVGQTAVIQFPPFPSLMPMAAGEVRFSRASAYRPVISYAAWQQARLVGVDCSRLIPGMVGPPFIYCADYTNPSALYLNLDWNPYAAFGTISYYFPDVPELMLLRPWRYKQ